MACGATLKRTMEFDPLMSPASPKRRRCAPMMSPVASTSSPQKYLRMEPSPFGAVVSSRLTTEQILHNIKQEYKRLQKRRHLDSTAQQADGCCPLDVQNVHSGSALSGTTSGASSPTRKEQPLFSLRQVGMICERLLKEQEEKIREEYDELLTAKLAEQYDAFVKFTHDQLMRRFGEQPASWTLVGLISYLCHIASHVDTLPQPSVRGIHVLLLQLVLGGPPAVNMFDAPL
ncbi:akirin-2 [Diretmus argenteus]